MTTAKKKKMKVKILGECVVAPIIHGGDWPHRLVILNDEGKEQEYHRCYATALNLDLYGKQTVTFQLFLEGTNIEDGKLTVAEDRIVFIEPLAEG